MPRRPDRKVSPGFCKEETPHHWAFWLQEGQPRACSWKERLREPCAVTQRQPSLWAGDTFAGSVAHVKIFSFCLIWLQPAQGAEGRSEEVHGFVFLSKEWPKEPGCREEGGCRRAVPRRVGEAESPHGGCPSRTAWTSGHIDGN